MSYYLGDFAAGATVTARFTTEDASGAPITLAGTPAARVRKGTGSGTVITAGVTLTVDVVTGQHVVGIDTSADVAYTAGSDYTVELSAGTVGGVSVVGRIVKTFSLANRADPAGVTTLLSRLSALRAGYLDNLSAGAVALEATLAGLITTVGASAAGIATAVWGAATRLLTAGTNIVLAKGTGVTGFTDLDAAGVRSAVGLATANLDTQIALLATAANLATAQTAIDAIKAKTDGLPSDPSDASDLAAAFATVNATLATVAAYIDTEVAAIKAKTDALPAAPAATGDIPTAAQNADKLLGRNLAGGSDGGRTVTDALRPSRNKVVLDPIGLTLTVYAEDDTTVAWSGPITLVARDALASIDPTA